MRSSSRSWENGKDDSNQCGCERWAQQENVQEVDDTIFNEYNHFSCLEKHVFLLFSVSIPEESAMLSPLGRCFMLFHTSSHHRRSPAREIEWKLYNFHSCVLWPAINYTFDIDEFLCGRNWMLSQHQLAVVCECNYANIFIFDFIVPNIDDDEFLWWKKKKKLYNGNMKSCMSPLE